MRVLNAVSLLLASSLLLFSCAKTEGRKPNDLNSSGSNARSGTTTDNPLMKAKIAGYNPKADTKLCIAQIRTQTTTKILGSSFASSSSSTSSASYAASGSNGSSASSSASSFAASFASSATPSAADFQQFMTDFTLSALGNLLPPTPVSMGSFNLILVDLEPSCPSGKSLQIENANGKFESNQLLQLKFYGQGSIGTNGNDFTLDISAIADQLAQLKDSREIGKTVEKFSGTFH
jgi:hypothetical protein